MRTHPSALLARWGGRLEVTGSAPRVIDIACGGGRNALYLARRGWQVDAIDISAFALERIRTVTAAEGLPVRCIERDLEPAASALQEFGDQRYNLALLIRYTNLPLLKSIARALVPGGYVIAEMHLQTDKAVAGPRSPRFRVAPNELRDAGSPFDVRGYFEGLVIDPDGRTVALSQLVGRRPG